MADSAGQNAANDIPGGEQQEQPPPPPQNTVVGFMTSNKVEAGLWLTRMFTVISSIMFLLPIFGVLVAAVSALVNSADHAVWSWSALFAIQGNPYTHYQRALISNAATSALRLHQRLPNFQFSRAFMGVLFAEDSCHYLFYSIIFLNSYPITMVLVPVFLFALLHACTYTRNLLNVIGPNSMMFVRNMITKLQAQQTNILRFIACSEIFLMPAIVFMTFTGKCTIFHPFVYYRFLALRYASRRNPYCRTLFYELRMTVEYLCGKPQCPQFVRNMSFKAIALITRLAPQVAQQ